MPDLESLDSLAEEVKRLAGEYGHARVFSSLSVIDKREAALHAAIDRLRDAAAQRNALQGHSTESAGQAVQRPVGEGQA